MAKFSESVRLSVLNAEDPYTLGKQLGMPKSTICNLLQRGTATIRRRGGTRQKRVKIQSVHLAAIERWIEETPDITLRNLSSKLFTDFHLDVSPQCIAKHIEGMCYSLKQCRVELEGVNNATNKEKRKCYAEKYMEMIGNGYIPIFEDETNFNLHCKRSNGRSKIGTRVTQRVTNSRGPNLHCIGAISPNSLVFFENRRGSLKSDDFNLYLSGIVDKAIEKGFKKFVIIIDNAPAHCKAEEQLQSKLTSMSTEDYDDIQLLRLAPYSHNLNPIENYWSVFKSNVKDIMRRRRDEIQAVPMNNGQSMAETRMRMLEETAQTASIASATPEAIGSFYNHLFTHLPRALHLQDMEGGN